MKIGVVGAGYWGSKVASEYNNMLSDGKISELLIFDESAECKSMKRKEGYKTAESLNELFAKVDSIHICTPNETHFLLASKAIDVGANALIEKPLTKSYREAQKIAERSVESGLIFQVGHIFRFSDTVQQLRGIIRDQHLLNDITHINLVWGHQRVEGSSTTQESILWDLLPHPLDIIHYLTDEWPLEVSGRFMKSRMGKKEEEGILLYKLPDGIVVSVFLSGTLQTKTRKIQIWHPDKVIEADILLSKISVTSGKSTEVMSVKEGNTLRAELTNFMDAVNTGKNTKNSIIIGANAVALIQRSEEVLKNAQGTRI